MDYYFTDYDLAFLMTLSLYSYGDEIEDFYWYFTEPKWVIIKWT